MGGIIFRAIRRYPFWSLLWAYRWRVSIGLFALICVDLCNVGLPLVIKEAIDAVPEGNKDRLLNAGIAAFALIISQSVMRYLWRWFLIGTSHFIARDLRKQLYAHLQKLPLKYYQKVRTGDLMSRATNDIEAIRMAVGPGLLVGADALFLFLLMVPAMFYLSPKLTLLTFILFPIVPWFTTKIGDRIDSLFETTQNRMSRLSGYTQEVLSAIRLIKSLVFEPRSRDKFVELSLDYQNEGMKLAKFQSFFSPALSLITYTGVFMILFVGGHDVIKGVITVGTFVAFQRFVAGITWPMEAIGWTVTLNREGFAAYRRLNEVLNAPKVQSVHHSPERLDTDALLTIPRLQFTYEDNKHNFDLDVQNLSIKPGQRVGLVGPVGSGKTTLFNLLIRLHEPNSQSIYFSGQDVLSIPLAELRQKIGTVEQQIFLFSEKVADNVSLGADSSISKQEVDELLQLSQIFDEIKELEEQEQTLLGERGVNLSGGQKQRVALSRALARKPQLLLLDDCFSAVDVEVEERIIQNLLAGFPELSFCIASHRMSIMPSLDEVWVMENGRITHRGTHEALLEESPIYDQLWHQRSQPREDNIERGAARL